MKILNYKLIWLLFILPFLNGYSQSDSKYFYYYQGRKVSLQADRQRIAISWEGDINTAKISSSLAATQEKLSSVVEDHTRNMVVTIDQMASIRKGQKTYYLEVNKDLSSTQSAYEKAIEGYKSISNIVMASPCFKSAEGKRMGLSNNLYVKLKDASDVDLLYKEAAKLNLEVLGHNEFMPLWFTLSAGKTTNANALTAANILFETGLFKSAEPAFMYHDLEASADPLFPNQWGLKNTGQYGAAYAGIDIKAEQAWTITTGSPSIKVAVFDHGFEMNHPDLQANTYGTGYDANSGTSPAQVKGSHGTACAGIVAAVQNNNLGVSGVAPNSKLISISINLLFSDTPQSLANGFNWAWQNGADVISNSWGGYAPSSIIEDAIANTLANGRGGKGTVIVFAAGNENNTSIRYPGNSNPLILVIGALSPCGERKNPSSCDGEGWGSCFGTQLDVMAPGVKIATTDRQGAAGYDPSNYTLTFNGTSSACPNAAGVAALVLSANPSLTVQQVNDIIEKTAQKTRTDLYSYTVSGGRPNGTWNNQMGYGLVDAYQAVLMASSVSCPANLTITTNVVAPNIDNKEASNSITATNIIYNGAKATYHAGTKVVLSPGFSAQAGSVFRAYIQGCTGTFSAPASPSAEIAAYSYRYDNESTSQRQISSNEGTEFATGQILKVYPNPSVGKITFQYMIEKDNTEASIAIFDTKGKLVSNLLNNKDQKHGVHQVTFNGENLTPSIYLYHFKAGNKSKIGKITIQPK
jgi:subtilisin family serine protease